MQHRLILRRGRAWKGRCLAFWVLPGPAPEAPSRWGVTVSRKVLRQATERNRWKRRIREILRRKADAIRSGYQGIFKVWDPAGVQDHQELQEEILKLLDQSGLLAERN